jgi:methyltransferase-like protein
MDKLKLLKLEAIKKLLMLDTTIEVRNVLDVLGEAISRELDLDDKEQEEFKKWKSKRDEIPF